MKQALASQGKFRAKRKRKIVKIFSEKVLDKRSGISYNEPIKNEIGN